MSDSNLTIVSSERGAGTTIGLLERAFTDLRIGKFILFIGNKQEICRYLENKKHIRYSFNSGIFSFKYSKGKIKCLDIQDILRTGIIPDMGYDTVIIDRIDFLKNSKYSIEFFQAGIEYNREYFLRENPTNLLVSLSADGSFF